jgi:hypothetical protein
MNKKGDVKGSGVVGKVSQVLFFFFSSRNLRYTNFFLASGSLSPPVSFSFKVWYGENGMAEMRSGC